MSPRAEHGAAPPAAIPSPARPTGDGAASCWQIDPYPRADADVSHDAERTALARCPDLPTRLRRILDNLNHARTEAEDREHARRATVGAVARARAAVERRGLLPPPARRYPGRFQVSPPSLSPGVAGDLAAALSLLPDAGTGRPVLPPPPAERLAAAQVALCGVEAALETGRRGDVRAALGPLVVALRVE